MIDGLAAYESLIVNPVPKRKHPVAPSSRVVPGSLHAAIPTRPWRRTRRRVAPRPLVAAAPHAAKKVKGPPGQPLVALPVPPGVAGVP